MAILSKIRERSMFLILVIGLALFAFVLDPSSIQKFFSSSKVNSIGEVNGESIGREEFARQVETYKTQSGGRVSQSQAIDYVWNNLVSEKMYKAQLDKAGIVVGEKDVWDAIVELPSIQGSQLFKNEDGLFNEDKLKEYVANLRDEADSGNNAEWLNWIATEKNIKQNLERTIYSDLVKAGLGTTLAEGEREYLYNNTKTTAQFVYVPYTSIADSLITITNSDVESYIKKHEAEFKVDESRDIKYVKFDVVASEADELALKNELTALINDTEEYSTAAKAKVIVPGFKNAQDDKEFVNENKSDLPFDDRYNFKSKVNAEIADAVFNGNLGDIIGPYKENGFYKLSKISEITKMPDSAKASHILIPFAGSRSGQSTKTEAQAKATADSIAVVVKGNKQKFIAIAKEMSSDKSNSEKGGELDWFDYGRMVPEFRDYCFTHNKGDVGVVKTVFGFHVIRIDDQKNNQKAVKLATMARKIDASEETENKIFQDAESFAADLAGGVSFDELAKEKNYLVKPAVGLKVLDDNIPGIANSQRQIVNWAFEEGVNNGDTKRFDIDKGYVVAVLANKIAKGLAPASSVMAKVRPLLINEKKAAIINDMMKGSTLEEIAKANATNVRTANLVTLASPTISGVGNEPAIVGAMSTLKEGELTKNLAGNKGVFAVQVTKRENPGELPNYETFRKNILGKLQNRSFQIYNALKDASDINDNRQILN